MKEQLEKIYANASEDIQKVSTMAELDEIRGKYLSRKGEFNEIKKNLKNLSDEDKRVVGALANEITQKLETALNDKSEKNDYLSDADHFHPNKKGYRYMTSRLYEVMEKHEDLWLKKGNE